MEYRSLGRLQVSVVGLGCNNFGMRLDATRTKAVVDAALDAGITYFDTAESYGNGQSEEYLGEALGGRAGRGGDRHQVGTHGQPRRAASGAATRRRSVVASRRA